MEVTKKGTTVAKKAVIKAMTKTMAEALTGLSINDAIEEGLITNVGNAKGGLIFKNKKVDKYYAIINGVYIQTSEGVGDGKDVEDLGELTFHSGLSEDKYFKGEVSNEPEAVYVFWARLGKSRGIDLEEEATTSWTEEVEA